MSQAIQKAKSYLRGEEASARELLVLTKELKKEKAFSYARKLLLLARRKEDVEGKLAITIEQQYALCTYKDQDLPLIKRLEDALGIVKGNLLDLMHTENQETLGIGGAIYKRKWEASAYQGDLEQALYYYKRGFNRGFKADFGYTGINAAYIHDLLAWLDEADGLPGQAGESATAHREQASRIRQDLIDNLPSLVLEKESAGLHATWWDLVTIAEAYFGLKQYGKALEWIDKALLIKDIQEWELESTTRQMAQLLLVQNPFTPWQQTEASAQEVLKRLTRGSATALQTVFSGKVGLALSGGGFRASLYHIGVLARLAEMDMLRHVEVLSCVSGGSIIGAYYYLAVRHLLETTPDEEITRQHYVDLVQVISTDFLDGVQRNIRTRVAANWWQNLRMFWSKHYSRTMRAGELYEKELFSKVKDGQNTSERWLHELFIYPLEKGAKNTGFNPKYDNWKRQAKVPVLILNATTLNTGHNWQFTASWMGESPASIQKIDGNYRLRRMYFRNEHKNVIEERKVSLGYAVAASACVPGMFEPLALENLYANKVVRLVDGGVHDNQGICGLLEQDCTVLLLSDASGQMSAEDNPNTSILGVPMRANDILMERVRNSQFQDMESRYQAGLLKGHMFIHLKLDLDVDVIDWIHCEDPSDEMLRSGYQKPLTFYGVRKELQKHLAAVRTDLDSFNDTEAAALMTSGYLMTKSRFAKHIKGFSTNKKEESWWFMSIAEELRKENTDKHIVTLLAIARQRMFKIWKLSRLLKVLAIVLCVVLVALAAFAVWYWYDKPVVTVGQIGWTLLGMIAALSVSKWVVKMIRYRETIMRFATGLGFITIGWIAANLHLLLFDKLYLKRGKRTRKRGQAKVIVNEKTETPP